MKTKVVKTKYWILSQYGPRNFSARATPENDLCKYELRSYFSRDAFEQDFGKIDFDNQQIHATGNNPGA